MAHKGPGVAPSYPPTETSKLRIGILHTRWNSPVVNALVNGCIESLTKAGVQYSNIIVQSVPGSYELPFGVQRMYTASQTSSTGAGLVSAASDLLGSGPSSTDLTGQSNDSKPSGEQKAEGPLDAIIAIGVLIKGSTMHFEYIADATSHGLMRVQLDTGCPVIFGLLTCLTEAQAYTRAGIKAGGKSPVSGAASQPSSGLGAQAAMTDAEAGDAAGADPSKGGVSHGESGHNHGLDWGEAALELGMKKRAWGEGKFID